MLKYSIIIDHYAFVKDKNVSTSIGIVSRMCNILINNVVSVVSPDSSRV